MGSERETLGVWQGISVSPKTLVRPSGEILLCLRPTQRQGTFCTGEDKNFHVATDYGVLPTEYSQVATSLRATRIILWSLCGWSSEETAGPLVCSRVTSKTFKGKLIGAFKMATEGWKYLCDCQHVPFTADYQDYQDYLQVRTLPNLLLQL